MFTEKVLPTVNGDFTIIDEGAGVPVLLLHGFPDSKELWNDQVSALVNAGFRAIAPDLRGYGGSVQPLEKESYAVPILMNDVIGILDALNLEKVHLVGHDWGAGLGWSLVEFFEPRFSSFISLSVGSMASTGWLTMEQKQKSWYFYLFLQEGLAEMTLASHNWAFMKQLLGRHVGVDQVIKNFEKNEHALTKALNWYRANLQHLIAQPGVEYAPTNEIPETPVPNQINIPVLGVWSTLDDYLTEAQVTLSADLVTSFTYKKLEGVGHWMTLEAPDKVNAILLDYLNQFK